DEFERVPPQYSGELYVEIVTRTFKVWVREGMKLNQLRFVRGASEPLDERGLSELAKEIKTTEELQPLPDDQGASQRGVPRGWPTIQRWASSTCTMPDFSTRDLGGARMEKLVGRARCSRFAPTICLCSWRTINW